MDWDRWGAYLLLGLLFAETIAFFVILALHASVRIH